MKIYVAAVEAPKDKKRQDDTQFTIKIDGFHTALNANVLYYYYQPKFSNWGRYVYDALSNTLAWVSKQIK